jgi:hypothetical protein
VPHYLECVMMICRKVPELASIMVFELHVSAPSPQQFAVRLVVQDGPRAEYETLPLPCARAGDEAETLAGPGSCTLDSFLSLAQPRSFTSMAEWCTACKNTVHPACKVVSLQNALADASASACSDGNASAWQLALAAVLPAVAVASIAAVSFVYYRRRIQRLYGKSAQQGLGSPRLRGHESAWSADV